MLPLWIINKFVKIYYIVNIIYLMGSQVIYALTWVDYTEPGNQTIHVTLKVTLVVEEVYRWTLPNYFAL